MSAESYDALGLIRTNELLKPTSITARRSWGTEADFGFSKTRKSLAKWGHTACFTMRCSRCA